MALGKFKSIRYIQPRHSERRQSDRHDQPDHPRRSFSDFLIFGRTGDQSERKLLPSLYHRSSATSVFRADLHSSVRAFENDDEEFQASQTGDFRPRQCGHIGPKN